MKNQSNQKDRIEQLLLIDYEFLQDYEIIDNEHLNSECFLAKIKDTSQMVKFTKTKYDKELMGRFQVLSQLFKNGIVLADNIFILEEGKTLYFYIIQAYLDDQMSRFMTLHQYICSNSLEADKKKILLTKAKTLLDCVHQLGESYSGLNSTKIIIDDEEQLYLAPYPLNFMLNQDFYSRSYYSPEILEMIHQNINEVTDDVLNKWDIWAFGCIGMEILMYMSPIFMSSTLEKQCEIIKCIQIEERLKHFQPQIKNLIKNCLQINPKQRKILSQDQISLSLSRIPQIEMTATKNLNDTHNLSSYDLRTQIKQIPAILPLKPLIKSEQPELRQLNLNSKQQLGPCKLIMNIFSISNIDFIHELHITVYLNQKYHFYLEAADESSKSYKLNRKITLSSDFKQMQSYLSTPIIIQIKEEDNLSKIRVNLQTLILYDEGKRIWSKPLIGTYSTGEDGSFKQCKMKLSCSLSIPENLPEGTQLQPIIVAEKKQQKQDAKSPSFPLKQLKSNEIQRKSPIKRYKNTQNIKSILQISQNLNLLTEHWKKKQQHQYQNPDKLQQKLQKLILQ